MFILNRWRQAYEQVMDGDRFTKQVTFTTQKNANKYGQSYFKPVGLFTNANCYSACDLLASSMQDVGAAIIYGGL